MTVAVGSVRDKDRHSFGATALTRVCSVTAPASAIARSKYVDLDGSTHYLDYGGNADGPLIVCVHGLGGAAWNWSALAPRLTDDMRVIAPDLAGHGYSAAAGRRTTVPGNRRLLERFLREVAREPVVLVGNSMGGAISALQAAATPDLVQGVVLVDPALPRPLLSPIDARVAASFAMIALPGLGEAAMARRRRTVTAERIVQETLALCCVDPSRVPAEVVETAIAMAKHRGRDREAGPSFILAARSVVKLLTRPRRLNAALDGIEAPVLLIHGAKDRLVPVRVARSVARAHPDWQLEIAADVGHVPQLEAAAWTADVIRSWLREKALVS
jgi:pimeloyl-ACP methyl ester carboxylesterase